MNRHRFPGIFSSYVVKFNTLRFGDKILPRLWAYYFHNDRHYMIIIYRVINPGLNSN